MIKGYVENNMVGDAREIFDRMMHKRNTVSWNSMIMACARENKMHVALKLFLTMPAQFKDVITWTTVISGLARESQISDAWQLFKQMPNPNSVSWSSIISGFQQNGFSSHGLILFREMLSVGVEPNSHSFTGALTACADLAALSKGEQLYGQVLKRGFNCNTHVGNSVISMFIKSGSLDNARRIFKYMPHLDMVTWNSMVTGYGQHGCGAEAIMVFNQMEEAGFQPDEVSFLGVLQGCSHSGLVEEGRRCFISMEKDYGISPKIEHYSCLVDILARAGLLNEAADIIDRMPFKPVAIFWRTLLNGCRIFGNLELGVHAADRVLEVESSNAASCLMVMEMYAAVGRWEEVVKLRRRMRDTEVKKELGCSWIEVKGKMHSFTTRDETHLESYNIYRILELLACEMWNQFV